MKKIYMILCGMVIFSACRKIEVDVPELNVTTDKTTYKVGETVTFNIASTADNLIYYSGEPKKNYDFTSRTVAAGKPILDFSTYLQNSGESNTLRLMASTDFNGIADAANIAAATWTDITSKATLSTGSSGTGSGKIDLSSFLAANKPLYLAFKYLGYQHSTLKQPKWTIQSFNLNNVLADNSSYPITIASEVGWLAADVKNTTVVWTVPTTGVAVIDGTGTGSINVDNEDWLISKPLNLTKVTPDVGTSIQSLNTTRLRSQTQVYTAAGTYQVTFVGFNHSIDDQKTVVKQMEIVVTP